MTTPENAAPSPDNTWPSCRKDAAAARDAGAHPTPTCMATCSAAGSWPRSTSPARCRPPAAPTAASPPSRSTPSCSRTRCSSATCCRSTPISSRSGNTSITVYVEVYAERNRLQADTVKVTEATLTYVATGDDRKPRQLPPLESLISQLTRLHGRSSAASSCSRRAQLAALAGCAPLARAAAPARARQPIRSAWASRPARRCPTPSSCGRASWPIRSTPPPPPPVALDGALGSGARRGASRRIAAKGSASAVPALAHSVHVDATGLRAGALVLVPLHAGRRGQPGRAHAHRAGARRACRRMLKLAVASCQHWEFGSYAAHRHIAAAAPDLVAFLGDYIYEWGPYQLQPSGARDARQRDRSRWPSTARATRSTRATRTCRRRTTPRPGS